MQRTTLDRWPGLLASMAICFAVSAIGGIATSSSVATWYVGLNKPSWSRRGETNVRPALVLFGVQLALNAGWSLVFFGLRRPDLAVIEIALLWIAIAATTFAFARISRPAAWMMVPNLAWVSFAALLNVTIWQLNY